MTREQLGHLIKSFDVELSVGVMPNVESKGEFQFLSLVMGKGTYLNFALLNDISGIHNKC